MSVGVSTTLGGAAALSALSSPERDANDFPSLEAVVFTTSVFLLTIYSSHALYYPPLHKEGFPFAIRQHFRVYVKTEKIILI